MGNHEHLCIVCGENTMAAFNYDCERRHHAGDITAAIARLKKQPSTEKWYLRDLAELAALLAKARPAP